MNILIGLLVGAGIIIGGRYIVRKAQELSEGMWGDNSTYTDEELFNETQKGRIK